MKGITFPQQNKVYGKPDAWKDEDCYSLPVYEGVRTLPSGIRTPVIISCVEVTPEEIEQIQATGKIWLTLCYNVMVPFSLDTVSPFPPIIVEGK